MPFIKLKYLSSFWVNIICLLSVWSCSSSVAEVDWLVPPVYERIDPYSEGLSAAKRGGKWGFLDSLGREVIAFQYQDVHSFSRGLAVVESNNRYGLINLQGQLLIPIKYEYVWLYKNFIIGMKNKTKAVLFNERGQALLHTEFKNFRVDGQYLCIFLNDLWGVIHSSGRLLCPPKYETIQAFSEGMAIVYNKQGKIGFIDSLGKLVVPIQYEPRNTDILIGFSEGRAKVRKDGKEGFIDKTGKIVIPLKYKRVTRFNQGVAMVEYGYDSTNTIGLGYVDRSGKEVIPAFTYEDIKYIKKGLIAVRQQGKWGFVNTQNQVVIPLIYDRVGTFYNDWVSVYSQGKAGVINSKGQIVIPVKLNYEEIGSFSEGFASVRRGDKWGVINNQGKEVVALKYDQITNFVFGISTVTLNKKQGIIDTTGRVIIQNKYQSLSYFSPETQLARFDRTSGKKHYSGYLNRKGKEVISSRKYHIDTGSLFSEGLLAARLRRGTQYGYLNAKGETIIPFRFKNLSNFRQGIARIIVNKKMKVKKNGYDLVKYVKRYGLIKNPLQKKK